MPSAKFENYTVLGILISFASLVISSFSAKKSELIQFNSANDATLRQYSGGDNVHQPVFSCCLGGIIPRCHNTDYSITTGAGFLGTVIQDADGFFYDTLANTSVSIPNNAFDTTSYLVRIN